MPFTDQKQFIVTEEQTHLDWAGGKDGKYFRCYLCGHKFVEGDKVRWQYTNDIEGAGGNPIVCELCDGTKEEVVLKWEEMIDEFKNFREKAWALFRRYET